MSTVVEAAKKPMPIKKAPTGQDSLVSSVCDPRSNHIFTQQGAVLKQAMPQDKLHIVLLASYDFS